MPLPGPGRLAWKLSPGPVAPADRPSWRREPAPGCPALSPTLPRHRPPAPGGFPPAPRRGRPAMTSDTGPRLPARRFLALPRLGLPYLHPATVTLPCPRPAPPPPGQGYPALHDGYPTSTRRWLPCPARWLPYPRPAEVTLPCPEVTLPSPRLPCLPGWPGDRRPARPSFPWHLPASPPRRPPGRGRHHPRCRPAPGQLPRRRLVPPPLSFSRSIGGTSLHRK